ncbi:COG3014 family protein [Desulfurispira natronophila]|uniref:Tetratricopeptide repeat protein n=1 Tax=Desulfurispira natronophila TaxID=682562 RepID=A0A7W7Y4J6_9BACT|nr:hypothetical protein [Desulfurispira natronophila]MBB5021892.1 hypothetical protein [Desulfurispira natronophila]
MELLRYPLLGCLIFASMLYASGCAPYSASFAQIEQDLVNQDPVAALTSLEKQRPGSRNQVLHDLNHGMLLRMDGQFEASNESLERAKNRMEELYAISVSEQVGSFLLSDSSTSYAGEEFEQVLVHLYKALNYLELGEPESARVEALQVDLKLREMTQQGFTGNYREDALARYLTGIVYEMHGEYSDALIAYRRAYETYQDYREHFAVSVPEVLQEDLLRTAHRIGYREELERFRQEFDRPDWKPLSIPGSGQLIVVLSTSLAPVKREESAVIQLSANRVVRISLPYYEFRPRSSHGARLRLDHQAAFAAERAHSIDAIASDTLKAKMGAITARSIARIVAKDQAVSEVHDQAGPLAGVLANIFTAATETADTRSWLTLPQEIYLMRQHLPAGTYTPTVEILGSRGQVLDRLPLGELQIDAGNISVVSPHWIPHFLPRSPRR